MTPPGARNFIRAVARTQKALDACGLPSMIIEGVAVVAHGVPRTTLDVDATVRGADTDLDELLACWKKLAVVPRIEGAVDFARRTQVLLLAHPKLGVELDVSLAWLPFEIEALSRSEIVDLGRARIRVPHVEDLIVYKVIAARPRDIDDAEKLLLLHKRRVSSKGMRATVAGFDDALETSDRSELLEQLFRKTGVR